VGGHHGDLVGGEVKEDGQTRESSRGKEIEQENEGDQTLEICQNDLKRLLVPGSIVMYFVKMVNVVEDERGKNDYRGQFQEEGFVFWKSLPGEDMAPQLKSDHPRQSHGRRV